MAERPIPILFNDAMVRAILDGRKTQTRRPVKPQPPGPLSFCHYAKHGWALRSECGCKCGHDEPWRPPAYDGDTLWVRECWTKSPFLDARDTDEPVLYRASWNTGRVHPMRWCPSIHMPRWAARIFLRVTDVRVERVRDISLDDINAEGVQGCQEKNDDPWFWFSTIWDSVYASNGLGWEANPWVWVVEFEQLKGGGE